MKFFGIVELSVYYLSAFFSAQFQQHGLIQIQVNVTKTDSHFDLFQLIIHLAFLVTHV